MVEVVISVEVVVARDVVVVGGSEVVVDDCVVIDGRVEVGDAAGWELSSEPLLQLARAIANTGNNHLGAMFT